MIQLCRKDKEKVYQAIRSGNIDAADMAFPNLIDDIVLTMKKHGLIDMLSKVLPDKRRDNLHIPLNILLSLAVTAKLKIKTSLTDVPFAVNDGIMSGISMMGFFLKVSCVSCFQNTPVKNGLPFITIMSMTA